MGIKKEIVAGPTSMDKKSCWRRMLLWSCLPCPIMNAWAVPLMNECIHGGTLFPMLACHAVLLCLIQISPSLINPHLPLINTYLNDTFRQEADPCVCASDLLLEFS